MNSRWTWNGTARCTRDPATHGGGDPRQPKAPPRVSDPPGCPARVATKPVTHGRRKRKGKEAECRRKGEEARRSDAGSSGRDGEARGQPEPSGIPSRSGTRPDSAKHVAPPRPGRAQPGTPHQPQPKTPMDLAKARGVPEMLPPIPPQLPWLMQHCHAHCTVHSLCMAFVDCLAA